MALFLLGAVQFNYHFWGGSGHAMVQSLVGKRMRAMAASLFLLSARALRRELRRELDAAPA